MVAATLGRNGKIIMKKKIKIFLLKKRTPTQNVMFRMPLYRVCTISYPILTYKRENDRLPSHSNNND